MSAAGTFRRSSQNRRSRRKNSMANRPQPTVPIGIVSTTKAAAVLTVVFNQPVTLKGVPQYGVNLVGPVPVSAVMTSPTTLQVTYTASIATATILLIPYEEPAIRNASGGFVVGASVALA